MTAPKPSSAAIPAARAEKVRVYLLADFGKGPRVARTCGRWFATMPVDDRQKWGECAAFARGAGAWWLVEAESADDARKVIAGALLPDDESRDGEREAVYALGRILASGGAK